MRQRSLLRPIQDETWREFALRQQESPFLACDPLYALTEEIIEAIQAELPGFFSKQEAAFERDLARTVSFGFFQGRALGATADGRQAEAQTGLSSAERRRRSPY
jgi:hypothetical protein